jgi:hypothetical protein
MIRQFQRNEGAGLSGAADRGNCLPVFPESCGGKMPEKNAGKRKNLAIDRCRMLRK